MIGPKGLVAAFAVTQTVGYGVLTYAFAVLLRPMAVELGTSVAAITGAMTVAIMVSAVAAVPIGRWMDRHGGRLMMTGGSLLGAAAVVGWSQVRTVEQLYAAFALIGLASAMALYEAAFAVVVAVVEPARRTRSVVAITIVAGFASTVFLPLTGFLLEHHGWRDTVLVLAVLLAVGTVPAHLVVVPGSRTHHRDRASRPGAGVREALHDRAFWWLATGFVLHGAAVSSVAVHIVRLLQDAGHPVTTAATLSGLLGAFSVTGRLLSTALTRRFSISAVTASVYVVQAAGIAALPWFGRSLPGAAICVAAFGLGFGVSTIARPVILAERYGSARFATIAAALTTPFTVAKAVGPLIAAALSHTAFTTSTAVACLVAAAALVLARS